MSDNQKLNYSIDDKDTFTNPALPNMILKKVNGKDYVVGVCSPNTNKGTITTANINIKNNK